MARRSSGRPTGSSRADRTGRDPSEPVEDAEIVGETGPDGEDVPDAADEGGPAAPHDGHGPGVSEVEATPDAGEDAGQVGAPDAHEPVSSVETAGEAPAGMMGDPSEGGGPPDGDRSPADGAAGEDAALVPASSVDMVGPPGPEPAPEEPEPTADDAPDVIEVPPSEDQFGRDADDGTGATGAASAAAAGAGLGTAAGAGAGAGAGASGIPRSGTPRSGAARSDGTRSESASRPEPEPKARRGGLGAMVLGGLLAGAIGFAAAWLLGQGPREAALAQNEALAERVVLLEGREEPDLSPIEARIGEVEGAIPDTAPIDARLAAVEGALGDVADTATLEALGERLSALEGGLASLSEGQPTPPSAPAVTAEAVGAVESVTGENADRLAAIEERLAALPEGLPDLPGRVDALADDIAGVSDEVGALRGEIEDVRGTLQGGIEETRATLQDGIEGVRGTLQGEIEDVRGTLQDEIEGVRAAVEEVRGTIQSREEAVEAERLALEAAAEEEARALRAEAAATRVRAAIDTGGSLMEPLAEWQGATQRLVPDVLGEVARDGVDTLGTLQSEFDPAARAALAAAPVEPGPAGFLRAQVGLRSLSEREGEDVDAVLSRAQARLNEGDLRGAVDALDALDGRPAEEMSGWLDRARARLDAIKAADGLTVPAGTEG